MSATATDVAPGDATPAEAYSALLDGLGNVARRHSDEPSIRAARDAADVWASSVDLVDDRAFMLNLLALSHNGPQEYRWREGRDVDDPDEALLAMCVDAIAGDVLYERLM